MGKTCTKCRHLKALDEFSLLPSSKDGRYPSCKGCKSAAERTRRRGDGDNVRRLARIRRDANKEEINSKARLNRKSDPAHHQAKDRQRYESDGDRIRARNNARYHSDPSRNLAYVARKRDEDPEFRKRDSVRSRRWRAAHPQQARELSRRRQLKLTNVGAEYARVLDSDPCSYCGAVCEEIDHIRSRREGGDGEWNNLTAACRRCNRRKGSTSLLLFLLRL